MTIDERGVFWLSDPTVTVLAIVLVFGVLAWSHRWIATGRVPRSMPMAMRVPRARRPRPAVRAVAKAPIVLRTARHAVRGRRADRARAA